MTNKHLCFFVHREKQKIKAAACFIIEKARRSMLQMNSNQIINIIYSNNGLDIYLMRTFLGEQK